MPNYSLSWNTLTVVNGQHTLRAVITDLAGNSATTVNSTVIVNNVVTPPIPTTPVLVGAYAFNEGAGSATTDISGNINTGTVNNCIWNSSGKYGNSLTFNGTSSHVLVADTASLDLLSSMTISAWVNPSSALSGFKSVVVKEHVYFLYASSTPNNVPTAGLRIGGVNKLVYSPSPLPVNTWTHLAMTYDGAVIRMYINGNEVSNFPATGSTTASTSPLWLGASGFGEYFPGKIDDVRIYSGALTQAQIQSDMITALSGVTPPTDVSLKVAYAFQEGAGGTVADGSGNAHAGTISGATWTTSGKYSNALTFDGVNDYVTTPDVADLDLTSAMTLEAWVYPTSTLTDRDCAIIVKDYVYFLYANQSFFSNHPCGGFVKSGTTRVVAAPTALALNTWTHLALTYNGSTTILYVNGVNVANQPDTGNIDTSTGPLRIGGDLTYGEYFPGRIDNVRVYSRALSAAEIIANMNAPVTFAQDTTPPVFSLIASSNITSASAKITWTTSEPSDSQVEYGLTTAYGLTSTLDSSLVTSHSVDLVGLTPSSVYNWRVKSKDAANNLAISTNRTFTTSAAADVTAPTISNVGTSDRTSVTANVDWDTNEASDSQVEYGPTTAYENGNTVLDSSLVTSHEVGLIGLTPSTTYHFRVKSRDGAGNLATGSDNNFATSAPPDMTAPAISSVMNSNPTTGNTTVTWETNEVSTSIVEYGPTTAYGSSSTDSTLLTSHSVSISGLVPGTMYHYRVKSADAANNLATSDDFTFITAVAPDMAAPVISNLSPAGTLVAGVTEVTLSCTTNELATVRYSLTPGASYGAMTNAFSSTGGTTHTTTITGLAADTTHTYYLKSMDAAGNANTADSVITFSTLSVVIPPVASITVISPSGGENWKFGKEKLIQWSSNGVSSNVNVELIRDGVLTMLFSNIANSGSVSWLVTQPKSSFCKIKITTVNGTASGISSNFFRVI